jgi:cell division protein FtsI/penicillin-binding protein 2
MDDRGQHGPSASTQVLRRADRVGAVTAWCITLLLIVMLVRVAQLQLAPSKDLREQRQSRVSARTELALRGDILDRRNRQIAVSRMGWRVFLDPVNLKPDQVDKAIVALARELAIPEEEVGQRVVWALEENARRQAVVDGVAGARSEPQKAPLSLLDAIKDMVKGGEQDDRLPELPELAARPEVIQDEVTGFYTSPLSFSEVPAAPRILKPIRYLPFKEVVEEHAAANIRQMKLQGIGLERKLVREEVGGDAVAAIVGKVGTDSNIGMEAKLNDQLTGKAGRVSYYRDSGGRPLWIEPGQVQLPVHGEDVRLSIDLELQTMGLEELQRGIDECDAAGGRLVAIDPRTGEILAMCDIVRDMSDLKEYPWEDDPRALRQMGIDAPPRNIPYMAPRPGAVRYRTIAHDVTREKNPSLKALMRNRCAEDVYEPGSTFKPFVWATITELRLAGVNEVIDTESGRWITPYGRKLNDVTKRDIMTWGEVLVNSSNIGMAKVVERLTHRQLHEAVRRFGFGKPTGLGVAGEASGIVTTLKDWTIYSQTSYAIGHEIAVTPLQMTRAFSAFARTGELAGTLPDLRLTAALPGEIEGAVRYRVLPSSVAELTRATMKGVTENMERHMVPVGEETKTVWKYTIFGKSGTAEIPLGKAPPGKKRPAGSTGYFDDQYNSSFVAAGPIDEPRLVVIAVIDDPGPALVFARPMPVHYGSRTAGPVVRRFMERALTYLGAPPSVVIPAENPDAKNLAAAGADGEGLE